MRSDGSLPATACSPSRRNWFVAPSHTVLTVELRPHAGRGVGAVIIGTNDDPKARKNIGGEFTVHEVVPNATLAEARIATKERLGKLGYPAERTVTQGTAQVGT